MNRRGAALIMVLVLAGALLPASLLLGQLSRSHLESALDDFHSVRAAYAAQGIAEMVVADLQSGGQGSWQWPCEDIDVTVSITPRETGYQVEVTVSSGRARRQAVRYAHVTKKNMHVV